MKTRIPQIAFFVALAATVARGQLPTTPPSVVAATEANGGDGLDAAKVNSAPLLTSEQLDQLLAPIALYPDALIAIMLPAATEPSDVVLAARYLADGGAGAARIEEQSWDDSVKALTHYPTVVKWMDENLAWTKQLGGAFMAQPAEVMKSLQRLRSAARAAGTLVDTPQQQVVMESETISIVPTQPDVIYVPYYDSQVVYRTRPGYGYYPNSFFTFSPGYPVGFWLGYSLDWGHRRLIVVDHYQRERYWREQRDWRRPSFAPSSSWVANSWVRPWTPNPNRATAPRSAERRYVPEIVNSTPNGAGGLSRPRPSSPNSSGRDGRAGRSSINPSNPNPSGVVTVSGDSVASGPTPAETTTNRPFSRRGSTTPSGTTLSNSFRAEPVKAAPGASSGGTGVQSSTAQAAASQATPPAPTVYSRGNRGQPANNSGQQETHSYQSRHADSPRPGNDFPAAARISPPAPTPAAAAQVAPVASAQSAAPQTAAVPAEASTSSVSRGGRSESSPPQEASNSNSRGRSSDRRN